MMTLSLFRRSRLCDNLLILILLLLRIIRGGVVRVARVHPLKLCLDVFGAEGVAVRVLEKVLVQLNLGQQLLMLAQFLAGLVPERGAFYLRRRRRKGALKINLERCQKHKMYCTT
jgi:hypothetical protein